MTPAISHMIRRIARRAIAQTAAMIVGANSRDNTQDGDPKIGGHPAACSSAAHILGALHTVVRNSGDIIASKPHAAPIDHVYQHHLGLFRNPEVKGAYLDATESARILGRLRQYPSQGEEVLQSYHAGSDADSQNFLPTGSVGLPAVNLIYLALAHRMAVARGHGPKQDIHFWALMGDSESREGSLMECLPDAAEREIGQVTWIVDYNRQSLDGPRICNRDGLTGTDADRLTRTAEANGWRVINLQHGSIRRALFAQEGGPALRRALEIGFSDYRFQTLLQSRNGAVIRESLMELVSEEPSRKLLSTLSDDEIQEFFEDLAGHDPALLIDAMTRLKEHRNRPTLLIAHTIKGWGLPSFAQPGNHSSLPTQSEVNDLLTAEGLSHDDPFATFSKGSSEGRFLEQKGLRLREGMKDQAERVESRRTEVEIALANSGALPTSFGIAALKNVPFASTQWMWGQIAARLARIADTQPENLSPDEQRWKLVAERFMTISPDVGTSTQISPVMNAGVFGAASDIDCEDELQIRDQSRPRLMPSQSADHRHIRMDIAEGAAMACAGSMGAIHRWTGEKILPAVTIYDFFVKRALDQLFYNLYWGSSFLVAGTPSGVTLSPEGAQHCWKSDFQLPGLITWEPTFAIEVDWILSDTLNRMITEDDAGRNGVLLRLVTRGLKQKTMIQRLRRQAAFKRDSAVLLSAWPDGDGVSEADVDTSSDDKILEQVRKDCLLGGYWLVNYRNYSGYEPGDNVVHIAAMGSLITEALSASDALLDEGIFADVLVVSSADQLLGPRAARNDHAHLQKRLGIDGMPSPEGGRIPVVGICDGEVGLLDNLGSIVGVLQQTLGTTSHSRCGRPADVYAHHEIDAASLTLACQNVLSRSADRD